MKIHSHQHMLNNDNQESWNTIYFVLYITQIDLIKTFSPHPHQVHHFQTLVELDR